MSGIHIRRLEASDGPGIAALFRVVYGDGYPIRTFYDPERLWAEHRSGASVSAVAVTDDGRVVGHIAVYAAAPCPALRETGALLVAPAFRRQGIATGLFEFAAMRMGDGLGTESMFTEAVCIHTTSQRFSEKLGYVDTALEVNLMPASAYTFEESAPGRVSTVLAVTTLRDRPARLFLPARYEDTLRELYRGTGAMREFRPAPSGGPKGETVLDSRLFEQAGVLRMGVRGAGEDLAACVAGHASMNPPVCQAWLSLADPGVGYAVEVLRGEGFFFGGVMPRWLDDDALLMQKTAEPPAWDALQFHSERARTIRDRVRDDAEG